MTCGPCRLRATTQISVEIDGQMCSKSLFKGRAHDMQQSKWISRTAGTIGKVYQQSKRPVALALVFIAAIGSVLPSTAIQIAALTALCAIIVEVLFEIQRYTVEQLRPRSFDNFYDASCTSKSRSSSA
jgi:hypothetical protein